MTPTLLLSLLACTTPVPELVPEVDPAVDPITASHTPVTAVESAPTAISALGETTGAISARVSFPDRRAHLVDVELSLGVNGGKDLELYMPVWTPGSYLVREYSRHLEGFEARNRAGAALEVKRTAKNRWLVETAGASEVVVSYRLYAREASVRTNFVDGDLAVLNGAATFLSPVGGEARPWLVAVVLPIEWTGAWSGLDRLAGPARFKAASYDELVDSPLVVGSAQVRTFEVGRKFHELVLAGDLGPWKVDQSAADVKKIVEINQEFWGVVPYERYSFLQVVNEHGGGLEHLDSTLMMSRRAATSSREDYIKWLGLVSHEFFHTWNIKRLRPLPLGPFDYENEVVSSSLWVAEGLTSYYDDLLLARAGLVTDEEYLDLLSKHIGYVQRTPGRHVQTLEEASAQAWIKHYRKDENTVNTAISYYTKGALTGWVLDAAIREATEDKASLDTVMRLAFERHSGEVGYTPEDLQEVFLEVGGPGLRPLLTHCLRTTEELDYGPALAWWGLRFKAPEVDDKPGEAKDPEPGWMGAETADQGGRRVVTELKRGTPAHEAGLQVDDELVAIEGWRVPPEGEEELLRLVAPGTWVPVVVSRRGVLRTLRVHLGSKPTETWELEPDPTASVEVMARRAAWLGPTVP